jgi:hypothetical protein
MSAGGGVLAVPSRWLKRTKKPWRDLKNSTKKTAARTRGVWEAEPSSGAHRHKQTRRHGTLAGERKNGADAMQAHGGALREVHGEGDPRWRLLRDEDTGMINPSAKREIAHGCVVVGGRREHGTKIDSDGAVERKTATEPGSGGAVWKGFGTE